MPWKNKDENNFTAYAGIFLAGILWGTIGIWATLLNRLGIALVMLSILIMNPKESGRDL